MASEQENRIVAEVMDNMKMAETEESAARRYVRRAVDKILIYCCREDLPERLEGTAAQIAEDMLKADLLVSTGKETSSVTRGDTTISYRDPSASRSATVDFMKNYETFCYFGIIAGVLVVAAFVWFLIHALRQSLLQGNRMGFLLGMACSIGLIVRVMVIYIMVNFGYGVIYTVAVPFFSTNVILAAVNGIYVGLLFCVLRNKMILKEPRSEKKNATV